MRALWFLCIGAALAAAPAAGQAPAPPAVQALASPAIQAPAPPVVQAPASPADQAAAEDPVVLSPLEQLQTDALSYVQTQAAALAGNYTFRVARPPVLPRVPPGGQLSFEPSNLSRRDLGGMFFVSFKMRLDGRPVGMIRVDMEGTWNGQLLRALNALPRKTALDAGAFESFTFHGSPPVGALGRLPDGYRLRTPIAPGHILVMQDLETIPVVAAGEPVRLELVSGDLIIEVDATARSSGAVGEKVRLEMPTSHRNLQAVVTGPGEARLQWAGN